MKKAESIPPKTWHCTSGPAGEKSTPWGERRLALIGVERVAKA